MNTFIIISGLFVFTMLTTMTVLYFKRDAELERAKSALDRTRHQRDYFYRELKKEKEVNGDLWNSLIAHDEQDVKFGGF